MNLMLIFWMMAQKQGYTSHYWLTFKPKGSGITGKITFLVDRTTYDAHLQSAKDANEEQPNE